MKVSKVGKLRIRVTSMAASSSPAQTASFADGKANKLDKLRIGVLGASGYTGSEVSTTPLFFFSFTFISHFNVRLS